MQPGSSAYATPLSVDEDSRVQPCNTAVSLPWWEEFNSNRYEDDGEHFFSLRLAAQGMNFTGLQTPSFEIRTEKNQPYVVSIPTGTQVTAHSLTLRGQESDPTSTLQQDYSVGGVTHKKSSHAVSPQKESTMLLAYYHTISQFETGESDCECGPYAVALNKYAGQHSPVDQPEDVDVLADQLWANFPHSSGGIDVPTLLNMLDNAGVHYQKIGSAEGQDHVESLTRETALGWLKRGYPVICTVNETNVTDLDIGGSPYPWLTQEPWRSNPPNHIFTLAGIEDDGNPLVADPANANAFPRRYALDSLN